MLATAILDQIRLDIASFADPGTEVEISDRSLVWTRSRTQVTVQLIRSASGFPDVLQDGRRYTYTSFLASEALADLKDLAKTIYSSTKLPANFVPVYAKTGTENGSQPTEAEDASLLILKYTVDSASLPLAATRVLFVHGNAGTGKTSALLQVTRLQAERYLSGQAKTLLLYLDAQGKGLSQLEDVMARTLQDLRARFTYHSVAALARRHCLVPIVDGFDELIGPSSAREAFSNLSQFLAQLDCEGALVASSRSAFIDYRTLHERAAELAASQSLSYEILPLEVLPWGDEAIGEYCQQRAPGSENLRRRVFGMMASPDVGPLVRKPFFLTKICDLLEQGDDIRPDRDITRQVVDAVLAREASKLRDQRGKELLTPQQHRAFCEAVADEMWSLGTPELDLGAIRLLAEIMAEQFDLSQRDTKTLIDRSVAHGLLIAVPGRRPEKRAFEHELFKFEFQTGSLAGLLKVGKEASRDYIQRAELPLEVVSRLPSYGVDDPVLVVRVLSDLSCIVRTALNNPFSATNAGSLASALISNRNDLPDGLQLFGFYLRSQDLGACCLKRAKIQSCILERVRLDAATLEECDVTDSQFISCSFGDGTRWDGTAVEVGQFFGVLRTHQGKSVEVYDPREIQQLLVGTGAKVLDSAEVDREAVLDLETQTRVRLVERLLTHARNHFYLVPSEDWFKHNLGNQPAWKAVEGLLRRHRLLEEVRLAQSGRPQTFLRLTMAPDKILQARVSAVSRTQTNAAEFWQDLIGREGSRE
ncbi:MAG: NACHT domain-containing protein [Bryobacteraceae bacterium]